MTPDLYGAWLTAGDRLQPVGDWLAGNWPWLVVAASLIFTAWVWLDAVSDNCRTRTDRAAAGRVTRSEPRPEPGQPGTDSGLLLDCIAIYGDHAGLQRLRDAIDQTRREER